MPKQKREPGFFVGVPDLSSALTPGLGIDAAEFAEWLAPHYDAYQELEARRAIFAHPTANVAEVARLLKHANAMASALEGLTPATRAQAEGLAGISIRDLSFGLRMLAIAFPEVQRRLGKGQRGRLDNAPRDRLLGLIAAKLGETLPATVSDAVTSDVLKALGIHISADAAKKALGPKKPKKALGPRKQ